ncbi:MAG TPA: hypothetical protein VLE23_12795 [Geminicoccaceae bacterium]|nr:hypothetical protein [Geminicoccaceae bacterium]
MTRRVILREIAHARAGDKGNRSNVAVYVCERRHYGALKAQLTPERLKAEFPSLLRGEIERFELDQLGALNFVMDQALEGGVNESLNLDSHGKSWSFLLLGLEVEVED